MGKIAVTSITGSYVADILVGCGDASVFSPSRELLGGFDYTCPYGLAPTSEGDAAVVVSGFLQRLGDVSVDAPLEYLERLRTRFDRLVLIDQSDPYLLCLDESELSLADAVLKANGTFRDRSLNNFVVGSPSRGGRWTEKLVPRASYSERNLEKLWVTVPCFLGTAGAVRRVVRPFYTSSRLARSARAVGDRVSALLEGAAAPPERARHTVHFAGSLTHVQRLDAVRILEGSKASWSGGISGVPEYVTGLDGDGMTRVTAERRASLERALGEEGFLIAPRNRFRYLSEMRDCRSVLSITGYGETCFRMAEALAAGRLLICQDVSHAEMLFDFADGVNVVFCRPDLSDLADIVDDVECNFERYRGVAERGAHDWRAFVAGLPELLQRAFSPIGGRFAGAAA